LSVLHRVDVLDAPLLDPVGELLSTRPFGDLVTNLVTNLVMDLDLVVRGTVVGLVDGLLGHLDEV
jgi:hypothetical protein